MSKEKKPLGIFVSPANDEIRTLKPDSLGNLPPEKRLSEGLSNYHTLHTQTTGKASGHFPFVLPKNPVDAALSIVGREIMDTARIASEKREKAEKGKM